MSEDCNFIFKIIIVGDGAVGKTSLRYRYAEGFFPETYKMTIGVDFSFKLVGIEGNRVKLQIWDPGGQERFSSVRPLYYKGSMGAFIVFDVTRHYTFEDIMKWLEEIYKNAGEIPIILIGNKCDLPNREVLEPEIRELTSRLSCSYFETSAKLDVGINEAYRELTKIIISGKSNITPSFIPYTPSKTITESSDMPIPGSDIYLKVPEVPLSPVPVPLIPEIPVSPQEYQSVLKKHSALINQRVEAILTSKLGKNEYFRFLITGNEAVQKEFLKDLLHVEDIEWPPAELNILYGTTHYKIPWGKKEFSVKVFLLCNLQKLLEREELFIEACENAQGLIMYLDLDDQKEFDISIEACKILSENLKDLRIAMIGKSKQDTLFPFVLQEELSEKFSISISDDFDAASVKILSPLLELMDKKKKKIEYYQNIVKKMQSDAACIEDLESELLKLADKSKYKQKELEKKKFSIKAKLFPEEEITKEIKEIRKQVKEIKEEKKEEKIEKIDVINELELTLKYDLLGDPIRMNFQPRFQNRPMDPADSLVGKQSYKEIQEDLEDVWVSYNKLLDDSEKPRGGETGAVIAKRDQGIIVDLSKETPIEKMELLGKDIYQNYFPNTLKQFIKNNQISKIVIYSNDFLIPYELMHDGDEFLARSIIFYRNPIFKADDTQKLKVPHKAYEIQRQAVFIANPTRDLKASKFEIEKIISYLESKNFKINPFKGEEVTHKLLKNIFLSPRLDIFHYSGHTDVTEKNIVFRLEGENFSVFDIGLQYPALFFLNSCESNTTINLDLAFKGRVSFNFPLEIMKRGAKACIATMWPVRDKASSKFAILFYEEVLKGESFGSAIRNTKNKLAEESDPNDITWMSFILYGGPDQARL